MRHRMLKRVALDFSTPLYKVWEGYINPYPGPIECNHCNGSGYNTATKQIADDFYSFDDRCREDDFIFLKTNEVIARAKRLGVFGECLICKGDRTLPHPDEAIRKLHEEWKKYEPPAGEGYQLWEICSEGSPVSPVFTSAEQLANWCVDNATTYGDKKTSYSNWLKMFVYQEGIDPDSPDQRNPDSVF